ncbi:Beta-1,3-glucanosyltransferase [Tolypocladium paradoxum]|uniref:Beta-1,3-glucanosyltransferase n=1 Tax=Tolypocladium paradoxum TaxID=94208 RepID=A0A2S4KR81_9HYPO|nr:Beta-1,3-glucanosyltransferase [Tolypocladium paradoxum]
MRASQVLYGTFALFGTASSTCMFPEPAKQICYDEPGGTPQNLNLKEVDYIARYLRNYQAQAVRQGLSPFWKMKVSDADNCAEWQVTTKGGTWALAKLVGDMDVAVAFTDIANTIDPGGNAPIADKAKALLKCGTAGGQMGVIVNDTDPLYESAEFVNGGFTTEGIVIKLVHSP